MAGAESECGKKMLRLEEVGEGWGLSSGLPETERGLPSTKPGMNKPRTGLCMITGRLKCDVRSGYESHWGRLVDTIRFQTLIIQR